MNNTFQINQNNHEDYDVITGDNFDNFIEKQTLMNPIELDRLETSTVNILQNCVPPSFKKNSEYYNTGLVLGYIQSGKTLSFTSLIALASDNNYKLIIVFAGTTKMLLDQTSERLREDLGNYEDFVILSGKSDSRLEDIRSIIHETERKRTIVIPILKHYKHINEISELFNDKSLQAYFKKNTAIIIDDESDQASLNTMGRKNYTNSKKEDDELKKEEQFSTTYKSISNLKNKISNHTYIQYTATPQANILLSQRDLLRPEFCVVLDPGDEYTGGKRFFNKNLDLISKIEPEKKENEDREMPESLKDAFRVFTLESAILCYEFKGSKRLIDLNPIGEGLELKRTSMMIHADRIISENSIYHNWLKGFRYNYKIGLENNETEEIDELKKIYTELTTKLKNHFDKFPNFEDVLFRLRVYVLSSDLKFWFVAGDGDDVGEKEWNQGKHHVLIGGQKLDRGFTVKELIVTYMPRTTKGKSNADTVEQRCRYFGYKKRYIEACKVYITDKAISEFKEYVGFEEKLRKFLKEYSIDKFYDNNRLMQFLTLNPTSLNKIPGEIIRNRFKKYQYFNPNFNNLKKNNKYYNNILKAAKYEGELNLGNPPATNDNCHKVYSSDISSIKDNIARLEFESIKEGIKQNQLLNMFNEYENNKKVWVIEIAHKHYRERSLDKNDSIKALDSNFPPEFGDKKLLKEDTASGNFSGQYNDEIIIHIHKIRVKEDKKRDKSRQNHLGNKFNTIAILAPESDDKYISINYD